MSEQKTLHDLLGDCIAIDVLLSAIIHYDENTDDEMRACDQDTLAKIAREKFSELRNEIDEASSRSATVPESSGHDGITTVHKDSLETHCEHFRRAHELIELAVEQHDTNEDWRCRTLVASALHDMSIASQSMHEMEQPVT